MHKAAARGDVAILELLLDSGLHPDVCSESPSSDNRAALSYASTAAAAALLLERGAKPLRTDDSGWSCLHSGDSVAARMGALEALLAAGADPDVLAAEIASTDGGVACVPSAVYLREENAATDALLRKAAEQWSAAMHGR
jgi:ankyrin repeat protein